MRTLAIILFALGAAASVSAQDTLSAPAWFDKAAKEYVKQDKPTALRSLDQALRQHPEDPKLQALAEALLKEPPPEPMPQPQPQQQQQPQQKEEKEEQEPQPKDPASGDKEKQRDHGRMTPDEARRLLDAIEQQERNTQEKVRDKLAPAQRRNTDKDW